MQLNLQIEGPHNGESEQGNSSDDERIVMTLRKMKKEVEVMVIHTVQQVIRPIFEDMIRKVVKEQIQLAQEKFLTDQNQNSLDKAITPRPRNLELKFLDEVSDPVLTGKEIKGQEGTHIQVSLVDNVTGLRVISGPEASAKVEILVLEAGPNDYALNGSLKDFSNSIIRENEKTKPHFPKPVYICLKKGIGILSDVRLGHDARWMKNCKCRLGARVVDIFDGCTVKEAWTKSFMVQDSRGKLYEKHYLPSLSDPVWRLDNIGKYGAPYKRLCQANISTVQEFLFLLSVDRQRLQKIIGAGSKTWKTIVDHALRCTIDDRRIYFYNSSAEYKKGVVSDTVGQLKGVLRNCQFVPIKSACEAEKAEAQKLLASAFENRMDVISFDDETSFLHQFPCISNDNNVNSSGLDGLDGCSCSVIENNDRNDPTLPVTSSQGIGPSIIHSNISCNFGSASSKNVEYSHELPLGAPGEGPSCSMLDFDHLLENFGDNEPLLSLIFSNNNVPEIPRVESHPDQQSTAGSIGFVGAVITLQWLFRVRKKVASLGDCQVRKRQRLGCI
ncbi:calmodulin-binding protein 60 A-like isoform X1 [Olea europaea var. sylvestris]|uniref:calmodulin-binding protein 60 A-like isoform X1 n=2 Tax=Olea europaea var. sylvestris TaxID=158386 RepID=UPI000C1CD6EA|nr:calmodulin-binding protein 60 A-like isoform X1 [Olea europaea var. sylvestris]